MISIMIHIIISTVNRCRHGEQTQAALGLGACAARRILMSQIAISSFQTHLSTDRGFMHCLFTGYS